ncbi:MAG: type II secretion system F family protein [Dehalococcoidia bacterium]|nr:type II secretion system F family protein [Dehalococcoidia bacterium]
MPYAFRACTEDMKVVEGTIDAVSEEAAEEALYQAGYRNVLTLKPKAAGTFLERHLPAVTGVKTQDVIDFSRELATLLRSGITLLSALELLKSQARKGAIRTVISGLIRHIGDGRSFSEATGQYPALFSHTYCQVIRAAEQAGNLEAGLNQIAVYMEKQAALTRKVTSALVYPALVVGMAVVVVTVLMAVAMPPLIDLFATLRVELPVQTKILIGIAQFFHNYKVHVAVVVLLLAVGLSGFLRLPRGKMFVSRLSLSAPIIGPINHQHNLGRFCRSAAMLLQAGLRLPDIIATASQAIPNLVVRRSLEKVGREILEGQSLSKAMAADPIFPPMMVGMVAVGEKTGDMERALEEAADYYERSVDQRITRFISLLEPVMTVVVGLGVAFVVLSLISPLYSVMRSFGAR